MTALTRFLLILLAAWPLRSAAVGDELPARLGEFAQEVPHAYTTADGLPSDDVTAVRVGADGAVRVVTARGAAEWQSGRWRAVAASDSDRHRDVAERDGARLLATDDGLVLESGDDRRTLLAGGPVEQIALSPDGRVVAAGATGLWEENQAGELSRVDVDDGEGRRWAFSDVRGAAFDEAGDLWVATVAGVIRRTRQGWTFYTGRDGLPYSDFTVVRCGRGGEVWLGTTRGVVRFRDGDWDYRQGRGWLPHDEVRDIALHPSGDVWLATAGGVGRIERRPMTLAAKAALYEDEIERLIKRTRFGYVSSVVLPRPGDRTEVTRVDSDNDGLWTAMYGASQCFAWGATRREAARRRARQAFEALRFLQKVTQGGEHAPDRGFVARTVIPARDRDPNDGRLASDRRFRHRHDRLWKVYHPRWPRSADGEWYWKGDTSSDELDGHYFFYPLYYDLVAEDDAERERVREVVRDLTDHLIRHDYRLVDHDDKPTRWADYSPSSLNGDLRWRVERGLNSASILSYLAVAEHVTGDPKYGRASDELVEKHGYAANLMAPKLQMGVGSGNQSDDEMAFMCFYNLVRYTRSTEVRHRALVAFYEYWCLVQPERNPFFHFAYAAVGLGAKHRDQWGARALDPWDGWLDDSLATLRGFPLDRVNWGRMNSHRLDLVTLARQQSHDPGGPAQAGRGQRVDGKVLPVENRWFAHWNTDPWRLDYPGDGRQLGSGTVFLLPYYMGLYHGLIVEPRD